MPRVDRLVFLDTPSTRRAVAVTGVRLAYAAPIVAASFRLSELRAKAEVGVSEVPMVAAAGLYPPTIEFVSYTSPTSVMITGRNLGNAVVTFETDQGTVPAGIVQSSSESEIVVSIYEGLTIFSTIAETPDGIFVFDQIVSPPQATEEIQALDTDSSAELELADQTQVEEPAAEVPVDAPVEAPEVAEPPVVEEAEPVETWVEEAPAPVEPVQEQVPVEPAPVPEEIPVVEEQVVTSQFGVGVGVVVLEPGATMYEAPTLSAPIVLELPAWSSLVIVGPMQPADGISWWQVQHLDTGLVGFVAETSLVLPA